MNKSSFRRLSRNEAKKTLESRGYNGIFGSYIIAPGFKLTPVFNSPFWEFIKIPHENSPGYFCIKGKLFWNDPLLLIKNQNGYVEWVLDNKNNKPQNVMD